MSQPVAWSSEQLVNTATGGDQIYPKVAGLEGGGFVAVWQDASGVGGDSDQTSVKGQLFDAAGEKVGGEFLVNTYTAYAEYQPDIAALDGGGFVVVWTGASHPDSLGYWSVSAQMFDGNAQAVGDEFVVNTVEKPGPDVYANFPKVTALDSGGFAVTWEAQTDTGGAVFDSSVMIRRVTAAGDLQDDPLRINVENDGNQTQPAIANLGDGHYAVVWTDASGTGGDASDTSIKCRIFADDGTAVTVDDLLINTVTEGSQSAPVIVGLGNGQFAVLWHDFGGEAVPGSSEAIIGQIVDNGGNLVGDSFVVTDGINDGTQPDFADVTTTDDGILYGLSMYSAPGDGSNAGVVAGEIVINPFLDPAPTPPILVNQTVSLSQEAPALGHLADGRIVVVYNDGSGSPDDQSGTAVRMRIIDPRAGQIHGTDKGEVIYGSAAGSTIVNDTIDGKDGKDVIYGLDGNDTIDGGADDDEMHGGAGDDTYIVDSAGDRVYEDGAGGGTDLVKSAVTFTLGDFLENLTLTGTDAINGTGNALANTITGNVGVNIISGGDGRDWLIGLGGDDTLRGGKGNDKLAGGDGKDLLIGGMGKDAFVFDTAPGAGNVDRVRGFSHKDDTIQLDHTIYAAIGAKLSAAEFFTGAKAHDANDRIIYNANSGAVIYDANGNHAGGAVTIAVLGKHLALDHTDFLII